MIDKPMIVVVDDPADAGGLVIHGLRQMHGQRVEVFALDHEGTRETVLVLLPENGPSLAAALRDWVAEWWSDGDEDTYGTPETYLRGLGVVIEPGDYTSFATSCPYCGGDDGLKVVGGTFRTAIPISADGFAFLDANALETEDEEVRCDVCGRTFSADAIRL